ncbi:MAG: Abi family protein [Fusobacterium sp.]|uniref:Abi family protein n=1 Tax=Fusobacterium sp. TaxID=68766 RepID=UPI0026DABF3D|nr:Abi family protein [Fusobacterium sp.]MDO4690819.1 Abi family protein [Fusobacterium sp.]
MTKDIHFDYEMQLDQFIQRGIKVKNRRDAIHRLKHLSYYKLKEFASFFRQTNGLYREGTFFETIIQNFYYDKNLRMEFLKCSEKIELSIKARICYVLGAKYGAFGYLKFHSWCDRSLAKELILKEEDNFKRKILKKMRVFSDNQLVKEFIFENPDKKYLSIWRVSEVLTFGEVLSLFTLMSHQNKVAVVKNYGLYVDEFVSYSNNIKFVRNLCAHNMAIINLKLKTVPKLNSNLQRYISDPYKIMTPILIMVYFVKIINPNYNFKDLYHTISQFLEKFNPSVIGLKDQSELKEFLNK